MGWGGLMVDWMILVVFFNLNDCVIQATDSTHFCIGVNTASDIYLNVYMHKTYAHTENKTFREMQTSTDCN